MKRKEMTVCKNYSRFLMCVNCHNKFVINKMNEDPKIDLEIDLTENHPLLKAQASIRIEMDIFCPTCNNGMLVHVDENIIDSIIALNNKGYFTDACCEGHLIPKNFEGDEDDLFYIGYILFSRYVKIPNVPDGWYIDNDNLEEYDISIPHKPRKLEHKMVIRTEDDTDKDKALSNLAKWVKELLHNEEVPYNMSNDLYNELLGLNDEEIVIHSENIPYQSYNNNTNCVLPRNKGE